MIDFLQPGDKVSLISPSAAAPEGAVQILSEQLKAAGLVPLYDSSMNRPETGPYASFYENMPYASSDADRLEGFQRALNDESSALWILHGGQGCEKIVAALERGLLILPPRKKIIIGFSGVSNLHFYFGKRGWPCLHGPVGSIAYETHALTGFAINREARLGRVIDVLLGREKKLSYPLVPLNEAARHMVSPMENTTVVGGCLNIAVTHAGTATALVGEGAILFLEDEPQRPERIETMMMGLIRSGTFKGAKALILGSFSDPQLNEERFKTVGPRLLERLSGLMADHDLHFPIFHAENFGHGLRNDPLPLGVKATLKDSSLLFRLHGLF